MVGYLVVSKVVMMVGNLVESKVENSAEWSVGMWAAYLVDKMAAQKAAPMVVLMGDHLVVQMAVYWADLKVVSLADLWVEHLVESTVANLAAYSVVLMVANLVEQLGNQLVDRTVYKKVEPMAA